MLSKLFNRFSTPNLESPSVPLSGKNVAAALFGSGKTSSGMVVGTNQALACSPVWAGVDLVSSDITRLPWGVYRDTGKGREPATDHPVHTLIASKNDTFSMSYEFRLRMMAHALLHGNAFARIHWKKQGARWIATRLEFIHSDKVTPRKIAGRLFYEVRYHLTEDGENETMIEVEWEDMFHLKGITINDLGGLSLVAYARNTIGRHLSAEMYGDDFFKNLAVPQGFFRHPGVISDPARDHFLHQMEQRFGQSGNRFRLGFLEENMDWVSTSVDPKDAMLIELMQWGIPDVARFFGIPPHKLGDSATKGWNTTEQENQSYFNSTLGKWTMRLKGESAKLFDEIDSKQYYTAFDLDELLSANTKDRFESYAKAIQAGWLTRNEARKRENLNPLPGLDEPLYQVNMSPASEQESEPDPEQPAEDPPEDDQEDSQDMERSSRRFDLAARDVLADQLERMSIRVARAAQKAAKDPARFLAAINQLEDEHGSAIRSAIGPAAALIAAIRKSDDVETSSEIESKFFAACRQTLLEASEVTADDLERSISNSQSMLLARARQIATASLGGEIDETNDRQ